MTDDARTMWFPVAAEHDLPLRHVYHGQLLGEELAIWRADDRHVNVWANRCLHRGVRLSIGINDGRELKCQYHGWRYSNRTAGCTYIPAHPAESPARTIANRRYAAVTKYGLVWTGLEVSDGPQDLPGFREEDNLVLRGIPANLPAEALREVLMSYAFQPSSDLDGESAEVTAARLDDFTVMLTARSGAESTSVVFFIQPLDAGRAVIRSLIARGPRDADDDAILRYHDDRVSALRDRVEARPAGEAPRQPSEPVFETVLSPRGSDGSVEGHEKSAQRLLPVTIVRKWPVAETICGFELRPASGVLPTAQPGAHIDVHMPNGITRQYSIVNGPGESEHFVIGVKREPDSRGGSACMHDDAKEGDNLLVSEPRNNFPLRRDAVKSLLIAGGIGITPIVAMAQALRVQGLPFELHYFAQNREQVAFKGRIEALGDAALLHLGYDPEQAGQALKRLLADYRDGHHVYICGPAGMTSAAREIAAANGWPESAVHFEYFKSAVEIDTSSSFEVVLARSLMTLQVSAEKSILETLRENGVTCPSACEQGACGTCMTTVLEGEPDHQDSFLTDAEKEAGTRMMVCVSRAKSQRLVLDI